MFVQVIEGSVADTSHLKVVLDRWVGELSPAASGWLGTTAGVTDDGTFVAVVRFESERAARRNSDRPEQGRWWAESAKLFTDEVRFDDYSDVLAVRGGGSDEAGFVQVMLGRVSDVGREREITEQFDAAAGDEVRPDLIGGIVALNPDGRFTQVFTSPARRRLGPGSRRNCRHRCASCSTRSRR